MGWFMIDFVVVYIDIYTHVGVCNERRGISRYQNVACKKRVALTARYRKWSNKWKKNVESVEGRISYLEEQ